MSLPTSSGCSSAKPCATQPPIDQPRTAAGLRSSVAISVAQSSARSAIANGESVVWRVPDPPVVEQEQLALRGQSLDEHRGPVLTGGREAIDDDQRRTPSVPTVGDVVRQVSLRRSSLPGDREIGHTPTVTSTVTPRDGRVNASADPLRRALSTRSNGFTAWAMQNGQAKPRRQA
jgi:hypothetical protein